MAGSIFGAGPRGFNRANIMMMQSGVGWGIVSKEEAAQATAEWIKTERFFAKNQPDYYTKFMREVGQKEISDVAESWDKMAGSFDKMVDSFFSEQEGVAFEAVKRYVADDTMFTGELLDLILKSKDHKAGLAYETIQQFPNSLPSLIGGLIGGGAGAGAAKTAAAKGVKPLVSAGLKYLGMSSGSLAGGLTSEFGGASLESLEAYLGKRNLEATPENILRFFNDEKAYSEAVSGAWRKAWGTAGSDALLMPLGSMYMKGARGTGFLNTFKRAAVAVPSEMVSEGLTEGIGLAAQKGEITGEVIAQSAFEGLVSGPQSVVTVLHEEIQQAIDDALYHKKGAALQGASKRGDVSRETPKAMEQVAETTATAIEDAKKVQALQAAGDALKKSKLVNRKLPDHVLGLLRKIAGEDSKVLFQTDDFEAMLEGTGFNPSDVAGAINRDDGKSYLEAKNTGTALSFDMADFVATMAPTELYDKALPLLRLREDGKKLPEIVDYLKSVPATLEELAAEAANIQASGSEVMSQIEQQLLDAGLSPADAKSYSVLGRPFQILAERAAVDPMALYKKYGISVEIEGRGQTRPQVDYFDLLIDRIRAGDRPSVREAYGLDIVEFLREKGGIDPEYSGGELRGMDPDRKGQRRPFEKSLMKKGGMELDHAAEILHEQGYIHERDIGLMLDLIDKNLRGEPTYSAANLNPAAEARLEAFNSLLADMKAAGVDLETMDNAQVKEALRAADDASLLGRVETEAIDEAPDDTDFNFGDNVEGKTFEQAAPEGPLAYEKMEGLDPVQRDAETRLAAILSQPDAEEKYAALEGTHGGKVLDTDLVRWLLPDFARSNDDRTYLSTATHRPSSAFINRLLEKRLAANPTGGVVFLAGAGGSGKTTVSGAMMGALVNSAEIIVDGTMSHLGSSVDRIQKAIDTGRPVDIAFIYRPFMDALVNGVVKRFKNPGGGRIVPLDVLANDHVDAIETAGVYYGLFRDHSQVKFQAFENITDNKIKEIPFASVTEKTYIKGGESAQEAKARLVALGKEDYREIEEKLAEVTAARRASQNAGENAQGSGQGDEASQARSDGEYGQISEDTGLSLDAVKRYSQDSAIGDITFAFGKTKITLKKGFNASTLIHEFGHLWLEVISDLAEAPNATPEIVEMHKQIMTWLGVEQRSQITREHHEKWARGFEAFFFEGRPPAAAVKPAMSLFRKYLMAVYETLRRLNVELTDDVRDVMARMFASDKEIAEAVVDQEMAPLFVDPVNVGMSEKDAADYMRARIEAVTDAENRMNAKLLANHARERKSFLAKERARLRKKVEEDISRTKEYVARSVLQTGKYPNGTPAPRVKLDRKLLASEFGPAVLARLPRGVSSKRGVSPLSAARAFGFEDAHDLIIALQNTTAIDLAIKNETERRLIAAHGDPMFGGSLSDEALKALHNERRAEMLTMELEHLASENLKTLTNVVKTISRKPASLREVKESAKRIVADKKVRDLRPHSYVLAERKAVREAGEAFARGDLDAAFVAKEKERLNHELFRAASEARDQAATDAKYVSKFQRAPVREKIGKAGHTYLDQIDSILDRFDFSRSTTLKEVDRRKSFAEFVAEQREAGVEIEAPDYLLDEAFRKSYKDMTVTEMQDLVDTVRQIEHMAHLKTTLLQAKKDRDFASAVSEITESIEANASGRRKVSIETRLPQDSLSRFGAGWFASLRKVSFLARMFDGFKDGGVFWEYIVRNMNEVADKEAVMRKEATAALRDIFKLYSKKELLGFYKKQIVPGTGIMLSKAGRLAVALNVGNPDSLTKLMDGYGWTEKQVKAIVDTLDARDVRFVNSVHEYVGSYWDQIAALNKRVKGIVPKRVETAPYQTKHGPIEGYYRLKYDDRQARRAQEHQAVDLAKQAMRGATISSTTRHGHRKGRVEGVELPVRLDLGVLFEHVNEVIHDLTHYEFLIDTNRLMKNRDVQKAIISRYGDQVYDQVINAVTDMAAGDAPARDAFEFSMNYLRGGSSIAAMGWNFTTAAIQITGLTQSMVRVGPKWVALGVSRMLGDARRMESTAAWVNEKSKFMALRATTMMREIREVQASITPSGILIGGARDSFFLMIYRMQQLADLPTWIGAYEKAMAGIDQGVSSAEAFKDAEARAVALADQAVIDSQGSGHIKDLAAIQRGGPMRKVWTQFYSYFSVTYNLLHESAIKTDFKKVDQVGAFAVDFFLLTIAPATLGLLIREALRGGLDDDDLWEKLIAENASFITGLMPGLRELSSVTSGYFGYEGPAGARAYSEIGDLYRQIQQGELDEGFWRSLNRVGGILFWYPAVQLDRSIRGTMALMEGETKNPLAVIAGPPLN